VIDDDDKVKMQLTRDDAKTNKIDCMCIGSDGSIQPVRNHQPTKQKNEREEKSSPWGGGGKYLQRSKSP
jgi:hypothetical protein